MCDLENNKQKLELFNFNEEDEFNCSFEQFKNLTYKEIFIIAKNNKIETHYLIKRNNKSVYVPKNMNMLFLDLIKIIKNYCNNIEDFKQIVKDKQDEEYKKYKQEKLIKNVRLQAFNILSDKKEISKKLKKTKLCYSVIQNTKCKHGDKCRFAHNEKDIISCECFFKENCIYVYKENEIYLNKLKTKICNFKHPFETEDNYKFRTFC